MTDEEWRACDNPARMRNAIRGRGFHWLRWLRFDRDRGGGTAEEAPEQAGVGRPLGPAGGFQVRLTGPASGRDADHV